MDMLVDQYGFDDNLFVSDPQDFLHCTICTLVLRDPLMILCCGHKFCSVCFDRVKTDAVNKNKELLCPVDREIVDLTGVHNDVGMRRMIGNLQVRCAHHEPGCEWVGDLRNMEEHSEGCHFKPIEESGGAAALTVEQLNLLNERLDQCEVSIRERDKEIAALRYQQQHLKDGMETLQQQLSEIVALKETNAKLEQKIIQLENKVEEHRIIHKEQQHQQEKQQQAMDELASRLTSLEKEGSAIGGGDQYGDDTVGPTAVVAKGALMPSQSVLKKKKKKGKKKGKEVMVHLHCDKPEEVTISYQNHSVEFHFHSDSYPTRVIAPGAVIPPHSKVWYEVEFTDNGENDAASALGWTTVVDIPSSQKSVRENENEGTGKDDHEYVFCPEHCTKRHNKKLKDWGGYLTEGKGYVGVALDLMQGEVLFSVEGQWTSPMGVAFRDVPTDKKFFPIIDGDAWSATLKFNFGDRPCRFGPPDATFKTVIDVL